MKLFINTSTLSGTGVTQVAVSFIEECKKVTEHSYYVLLSSVVASQIDQTSFPSNFRFYEMKINPRLLFNGYATRKKIRDLEREIDPDCVFSIFGPSYWTPKCPHLMGYAYAHYVYPESPYFDIAPSKDLVKSSIYKLLHKYFLKKNGAYYVCETIDVTNRLVRIFNIDARKVYTVSNTYNHFFDNFHSSSSILLPARNKTKEYRFLSLCSFATHKNLDILNKVVPILNSRFNNINIKFVLTVDDDLLKSRISHEAIMSIINLGRIDVSQCPQLYSECDALFLPTLLECFTANYAEAMKMKLPILTSNLSFAKTICNEAAMYFDPLDPEDIVQNIIAIIKDDSIANKLVDAGIRQLQTFNSSAGRAKAYLEICERIKYNA